LSSLSPPSHDPSALLPRLSRPLEHATAMADRSSSMATVIRSPLAFLHPKRPRHHVSRTTPHLQSSSPHRLRPLSWLPPEHRPASRLLPWAGHCDLPRAMWSTPADAGQPCPARTTLSWPPPVTPSPENGWPPSPMIGRHEEEEDRRPLSVIPLFK
jgi:hypothetical protein